MIIAERNSLTPVRVLANDPAFKLELFEDKRNNLYMSCNSTRPDGMVCFATTPSLLCSFLVGSITLQGLFDNSPSRFVEIINKSKTAIYSRNDIEVKLTYGEQSVNELTLSSKMEIWGS
ncbi:MAG TPA: hypothetical protein VNS50_05180 [Ginsengibacter sp.]|nr:hypothetical protein [Ginsengibacter sp.]